MKSNPEFMCEYVNPDRDIVLHLLGREKPVILKFSESMHNGCYEFRGEGIKLWFKELNLLDWPYGKPHEFIVEALEKENHFSIRRA